MDSQPMIDPAAYAELKLSMGDDFIGEIVAAYLEDTPRLLDELRQRLTEQDAAGFSRAAHSIKSSSAALGALTFSALAKELEALGKQGNLAGADEKVKHLEGEYLRVAQSLQALSHA